MARQYVEPFDVGDPPGRGCDDPETVRRAQRDSAAFTTLFDCFWELILRYCYGRLRSWPDAEDAAQAAFFQAVTHLPEFELRPAGGGFRSWLLRVAHNESASFLRLRIRRPALPFPEIEPADPTAGDDMEAIAINDWLAGLCATLSPARRDVIEFRLAGATTKEIAQILGKSEKTVNKLAERAIADLVKRRQEQEGEAA